MILKDLRRSHSTDKRVRGIIEINSREAWAHLYWTQLETRINIAETCQRVASSEYEHILMSQYEAVERQDWPLQLDTWLFLLLRRKQT